MHGLAWPCPPPEPPSHVCSLPYAACCLSAPIRCHHSPFPQARALGFETRNVANDWLQPLDLRNGQARSGSPSSTQETSFVYTAAPPAYGQLSPHYGPGQNSPKQLAQLRTTRTLQTLGKAAIYSDNPYVESALETLLPGTGPMSPTTSVERLGRSGRLPRKGAKNAAMCRARRVISQGMPFLPEVPFADAVRVCNLAEDRSAMPQLLQTYILKKQRLPLAKLEYYTEVLTVQPPLIQLQVGARLRGGPSP
jgi:hypothetical protein